MMNLEERVSELKESGYRRLITWLAGYKKCAMLIASLIEELDRAGASLYIVGGSVRDLIEGKRELKDIDLMVTGTTYENLGVMLNQLKSNRKLGIKDITNAGKHFPVYKMSLYWSRNQIDIALARNERSTGTGHRDFSIETAGVDAREDSCRRDFTINALFFLFSMDQNSLAGTLIDFQGGIESLARKEIKAVGNAGDRFREDPLRMLRAIRQKNERKAFHIEEKTWHALVHDMPLLIHTISKERITEELIRSLRAQARQTYLDFRDSGALEALIPELARRDRWKEERLLTHYDALTQCCPGDHPGRHYDSLPCCQAKDSLDSTLLLSPLLCEAALDELETNPPVDPSSAECYTVRSPEIIARRLAFPNIKELRTMVQHFIVLLNYQHLRNRKAVAERILWGNARSGQIIRLYNAHRKAAGGTAEDFDALLSLISARRPLIDGTDLLQAGMRPGPHMSIIMESIREKELDGELFTAEESIAFGLELYRKDGIIDERSL